MKIKVTINGAAYERDVADNITLLHFLREEVGLTAERAAPARCSSMAAP
jgi:aerobic-type carbon monoxide dehydrogenase small subunit (CoxS/CutS family)